MKNKPEGKLKNHKKRAGDFVPQSDSDDDKYKVSKKDDESVDDSASDVGWNSDDEMAFDSRRGKKHGNDSEDEEDEYYSDEDNIEGGMLLSDMLDMPKKSSKPAVAAQKVTTVHDDEQSEESDSEDNDEDDEESDMYSNDSESESELDENEEYSEEAHAKLLKSMDKFSKSADAQLIKSKSNANQTAKESAFSSLLDGSQVSMNTLLGALENTQDLSAVRQQLEELTKSSAAPTYIDKVISDRAERHQAYDSTKTEMNKWQETVVTNRHKRVLDLAQDKRQLPTTKALVNKFVASTPFEREIQMVLVKHGTTDAVAAGMEQDELGERQLDKEDLKERQGELAKIKALMFYEQMKRHRLNKIKSKAYRTIQKRQKKRLAKLNGTAADGNDDSDAEDNLNEEVSEEQREKMAYDRVKERMDMRHKNTSKWAKMALQHGHHDKNLRAAYHESVLLGHELTAKMNEDVNKNKNNAEGSDAEEYYTSTSNDNKKRKKLSGSVSSDAAAEMQSILSGAAVSSGKVDGKYSKLFDMDFMKKAATQQQERSREAAESILREIEEMEGDSDNDNNDNNGDSVKKVTPVAGVAIKRKRDSEELAALSAAKSDMQTALGSSGISYSKKGGSGKTSSAVTLSTPVTDVNSLPVSKVAKVNASQSVESNPWLQPAAPASASSANNKKTTANNNSNNSNGGNKMIKIVHNPAAATSKPNNTTVTTTTASAATPTPSAASALVAPNSKLPARAPLLMQKSQADLVKIAFSGPDYEADFEAMKHKQVDEELGLSDKTAEVLKNVKAGWGDWAGPGAMLVSKKIADKRDRLITKIHSEGEAKRMERKDNKLLNVMISERRVKTASKYKIAVIPHPYTSWEEYERSLQMPLGEEWNASNVVKNLTQPAIKMRAGRIIEPVKLQKKQVTK